MTPKTKAVRVNCPDCGNRNRKARRECRKRGGMCLGTGTVIKYVPVEAK